MKIFNSFDILLLGVTCMSAQVTPATTQSPSQPPTVKIMVCPIGQNVPITYDANYTQNKVDPRLRPPQQIYFKTGKRIKKTESGDLTAAQKASLRGDEEEDAYEPFSMRLNLLSAWSELPKVAETMQISLFLREEANAQTGAMASYKDYLKFALPMNSSGAILFLTQTYPSPYWTVPPAAILVPFEAFKNTAGLLAKDSVLLVNSFPYQIACKIGDVSVTLAPRTYQVVKNIKAGTDVPYVFKALVNNQWIDFDNSEGTFIMSSVYARCFSFHVNYISKQRHPLQFYAQDFDLPTLTPTIIQTQTQSSGR